MAELQTKFEAAAEAVKKAKENMDKLPQEKKEEVYGLYKQATVGDINIAEPGVTDPLGQAKFKAWSAKKGLTKEEAQQDYIDCTTAILESF